MKEEGLYFSTVRPCVLTRDKNGDYELDKVIQADEVILELREDSDLVVSQDAFIFSNATLFWEHGAEYNGTISMYSRRYCFDPTELKVGKNKIRVDDAQIDLIRDI